MAQHSWPNSRFWLGLTAFLVVVLITAFVFLPSGLAAPNFEDGVGDSGGPLYYDSLPPADDGAPASYVVGASWDHNPVSYTIANCPRSLDCGQAQDAVRGAVEAWDAVCGLRLDELPGGGGDITILWAARDHGDGEPFDGPGGVLAHAFFPVSWLGSLAGDVHLDDDENWVTGNPSGNQIHLRTVAMHEVGHALGLDHSNDPSALMWDEYVGVREIGPDDIAGIQAIYGPPSADEGGGSPPPTSPPNPGGVTATATTTVRIRSGPGTSYPTVGRVTAGAVVPVLGRIADNSWLQVEFNGVQGWVAAHLFVISGDLNTVPVVGPDGGGGGGGAPTPTAQPAPPSPTGVTATATTTVRVRSGPGTNYPTLGRVTINSIVPVLGRNANSSWLYVDNNSGVQGWVAAHLFIISGDLNNVPVMYRQGSALGGANALALSSRNEAVGFLLP